MAALVPTHRKREGGPWQQFNEVTGQWDNMPKAPAARFRRMHKKDDWQYFGDQANQPVRVYTLEKQKVTAAERRVLEKYLADVRLHRKLLGQVANLPLIGQLDIAEQNVELVLDSGYWLAEIG